MTQYVLIDIGCIECGETSSLAGLFGHRLPAELHAQELNDRFSFTGGQHSYEVFELPDEFGLLPEYLNLLEGPK